MVWQLGFLFQFSTHGILSRKTTTDLPCLHRFTTLIRNYSC